MTIVFNPRRDAAQRCGRWLALAAGVWLLAGCGQAVAAAGAAAASLGISSEVQVAPVAAAPAAPVTVAPTPAFTATAGVAPLTTGNPIPRVITRIPLVGGVTRLADFRLDADAGIAYLTDSDYVLHVVDLAAGTEITAAAVTGDRLLLDPPHARLYIMPDSIYARSDLSPTVTFWDTERQAIEANVPGSRVAVNNVADYIYVGEPFSFYDENAPGVRVYDGTRLKLLLIGEMAGAPLYNPVANELIILRDSAWTLDPLTLQPRGDLYPQITGIDLPGCFGCPAVVDGFVFPEQQVVAIETTVLAAQGAGRQTPPDFYAAATMERLPATWQMGATCSSQPQLYGPLGGRVLRGESYLRYVAYDNLLLDDEAGNRLLWRDGLRLPFVNPQTGAGYLQRSATTSYVLDLGTLAPVGVMDSLCFFARDATSGLLYATDGARHDLVILEPTGGESQLPAPQRATLRGLQITDILLSPAYASDATLFLVAWTSGGNGQAVLRSTDGGATWTQLGGLPVGQDLALTLAISPDFVHDRTLFVGGAHSQYAGEGVWKSTDAGDTWTPMWDGLEHLRTNRIVLSPHFQQDQTLLAYAPYTQIYPWQSGYSLHRSTDAGLTWTRVMTAEYADLLPGPSAYLPITASADLPVRKREWYSPVEVRIGSTGWTTATAALGAQDMPRLIAAAPHDDAIYVVTEAGVYRTQDAGATWTRLPSATWGKEGTRITAAALTPLDSGGGYRLLLATSVRELVTVDPPAVQWARVEAAASPAPTIGATATAPPTAVLPTATPPAEALPQQEEAAPAPATPAAPATPTPDVPGLSGEPPTGLFRPGGIFGPAWAASGGLQQAMGWARSEQPQTIAAAYQYFEHGAMIWRGDKQQIYVLYDGGAWAVYSDTFKEGEAESDPSIRAPDNRQQPVRGFGKVWRDNPAVRDVLGWATGKEAGLNALFQDFERGLYLRADALEAALIDAPEGKRWARP